MSARDSIIAIQELLGVTPDGDFGKNSNAALQALLTADPASQWPTLQSISGGELAGDGTWPWKAHIDGDDIVVLGARATCFGGSSDPQDNGDTASGISTKKNPDLAAVSLPMDGLAFHGLSRAEHAALDGSPIPRIPWNTPVEVTSGGITFTFPVIDLGPGKRTGNALDLTIAAARMFNPKASATNFELRCDYRILGGAQFAT